MNQTASYAAWTRSLRGDRRRSRRDRRRRQAANREKQQHFEIKLKPEEKRRLEEQQAQIDSWVSFLSNYSWCHFLTLTFRSVQGPESIDRAIRRLMRFIHEDVYGKFDPLKDVRDLFGVRYFPAVERGRNGTKRLHAHVLITGGDLLGKRVARVANARWTAWREWWNREYGGLHIDRPREQGDVAAYCTKYVLKGDDAGFELRSTWSDERDWRKRAEAPLLEERKIGIDVTRSAELEKSGYRGEAPNGCGPASKGSGKVCHRCGLVSLCRCSIGTSESGQVVTTPEPDAGACEGGVDPEHSRDSAPPSPQMELRMQQQLALPVHASASKSGRFSSRREKYLQRRRDYELRRSRQVSNDTASKLPSKN